MKCSGCGVETGDAPFCDGCADAAAKAACALSDTGEHDERVSALLEYEYAELVAMVSRRWSRNQFNALMEWHSAILVDETDGDASAQHVRDAISYWLIDEMAKSVSMVAA